MKKRLAAFGLMAVAALALAGCTDSAAGPTAEPSDSADAGGTTEEVRDVRVAALPIAESGAL